MSRVKGDRPLMRSDIIDILHATNAANFALKNGRLDARTDPSKGKFQPLPLTVQNLLNEVINRLQRVWDV